MPDILGLDPIPGRRSWEKSLGEFLEIVVGANPDKVFVEIAGQQITYADFYRRCRAAAAMFHGLGIRHGDRVCMFLPNVPEVLYTWFGLALIGGIAVTVNTAYRRDEMAFILNNAEASALVAHETLRAGGRGGRRPRAVRPPSPHCRRKPRGRRLAFLLPTSWPMRPNRRSGRKLLPPTLQCCNTPPAPPATPRA